MDTQQSLPAIVDPTIFEIFDQTKDQLSAELQYGNLGFKDYFTSIPNPKFSTTSGLSIAQLTLPGTPYSQEDRTQGYTVQVEVQKYTKQIAYNEELIHWIMAGNKEMAQEFQESAEAVNNSLFERIDTQAARMYYLAHTTTHQTGGDGVALAAYNHPSTEPGIAVQRNIFETTEGNRPITYDSLVAAMVRLSRFYDLKGVQMKRTKKFKLFCSIENEDAAKRAINSDKKPGTELNDDNTLKGRIEIEVISYQPASYGTYWALVDMDRMARGTKMLWGWKPRIESETEYRNGTFYKPGSVFLQSGFRDWQWMFASKGDSSAILN